MTLCWIFRIGGTQPLLPTITGPGMWWFMTGSITMDTETSYGWAERQHIWKNNEWNDTIRFFLYFFKVTCLWWSVWSSLSCKSSSTNSSEPAWPLNLEPKPSLSLSVFCLWSLQLSKRKFRAAAMLSVFIVSAVVHEYALTMGFGFFYPVMFFLFAVFGGDCYNH